MEGTDMSKTVELNVECCGKYKDGKPVFGFLSFTISAADDELVYADAPPNEIIDAMARAAEVMGVTDLQIINTRAHDSMQTEACRIANRLVVI
jgi:hypothetical protein